jgi:hypothetical protein
MNPIKVKTGRIKRLKNLFSKKQDSQTLSTNFVVKDWEEDDSGSSDSSGSTGGKDRSGGIKLLPQLRRLLKRPARPTIIDSPDKKEDEGSGEEGSSGGTGGTGRFGDGRRKPTYLGEETPLMDRKRREMEQTGHRQLAKVHAREHKLDETTSAAPEGELQNSIMQHPWLDGQRFDGIDPNVNPEPPLNTDARREFDNERREQEMEKQLRLGNMPKFSSAPKPEPR